MGVLRRCDRYAFIDSEMGILRRGHRHTSSTMCSFESFCFVYCIDEGSERDTIET